MNPNSDLRQLRSTSIMGADAMPDEVEALLALAADCSLTIDEARSRMGVIAGALAGWRDQARNHGIAEREIAMVAKSIQSRLDAVARAGR